MSKYDKLVMNKQQILQSLKKSCSCFTIKLPVPLDFSLDKACLIISIPKNKIVENMQTDSAAFEGWALVLKRWITEINRVVIEWEEPDISSVSANEMQHYQRFLYRAKRFSDAFEWVDVSTINKGSLKYLKVDSGCKVIMNTPTQNRPRKYNIRKPLSEYSESQLEELILTNKDVRHELMSTMDLSLIDNQLPVGVFEEVKSNATKIFTGGKSAIDIWGINNKNEFCLFELKNSNNRKVGALSEMLFYSFLIQDVIKGIIDFDKNSNESLEGIKKAKRVNCFLLAPSTHPLIDKDVFNLLNKSVSLIDYGNIKVNNNLSFTVL